MHLQSVEVLNFGPFAFPESLRLEPDVTVLTGPNDVGKSSLLRLLGRVGQLDGLPNAEETDFNMDRRFDSSADWTMREDFGATVSIQLTEPLPKGLGAQLFKLHTEAQAQLLMGPGKVQRIITKLRNAQGGTETGGWPFPESVRAVWLPSGEQLKDLIDFSKANGLEKKLLRRAFGNAFQPDAFKRLSPMGRLRELGQAEQRLNTLMTNIVPTDLGLMWKLREQLDQNGIGFMLQDRHGGVTALGSRGTGIQKVMGILAHLMDHDFEKSHTLVLFDEPENSLHADSQHLLRRLLENLGARPDIQVVYTTHSPSMINPMRPHSVRLLRRSSKDGLATTFIDNQPFKENYSPIRTSLGLTPADSLLYAPVTIVVEGDTEVVGLPLLLLKLAKAKVNGFEDAELLLSQSHLLDGLGDRFGFVCQLAKSQGARPIIFLDGDKKRHLAQHKLSEKHPDVPVVTLHDGTEFEQLVPLNIYIQALAETVSDGSAKVTTEGYTEWERTKSLPSKIVFTKRVGRWLDDLSIDEPSKAQVMRRAVELVMPEQVQTDPLRELLAHIKRLIQL